MRVLTSIFLTALLSLSGATAASQNETNTTEILGLYQNWRDAVESANIDGYIERLRQQLPGMNVTRADAIRQLLTVGLKVETARLDGDDNGPAGG